MGIPNKTFISEVEYLESEKLSLDKHEYFQGEVFAMSGASDAHNVIAVNCTADLRFKLKGKSFRPYGSDMRLNIPENSLYTYPDLSVYCSQIETLDNERDTAKNPIVIFEILSKSTRNYDQGEKFTLYRQIPTLKEYILIDSDQIKVMIYAKTSILRWTLTEFITINDTFEINSLGIEMKLIDIYEDVKFIQ